MKDFKIFILLLLSLTLFSAACFLPSNVEHRDLPSSIMVVEADDYEEDELFALQLKEIDHRLEECRTYVQGLCKNHSAVMAQYDSFANLLTNVYYDGRGFINTDIHLIIEATRFAAEKHKDQKRKGDLQVPYIIHPMAVAENLLYVGKVYDRDVIIAAILHDTVEDTETTFEEIQSKFGDRVTAFVKEVTDDKSLPKDERKNLQIVHASGKSAGAAQIKLADKMHNLQTLFDTPPEDWTEERVQEYFQWAQQVVDALPWVNGRLKSSVDEKIADYWDWKNGPIKPKEEKIRL